ncbi:MAG TPA: hypothetical protein PKZ92_03380 [Candidatus Woesebacteria bacterium]|jgi:hypothetical protein|nr:hypothetical protein [Candidatus Shapirobacteria bacterium]HOR02272.1 hypothetical protein [Candidatus Woesebacteria bacterium]
MSDLNLLPSEAKFQAEKIKIKGMINNFLWIFGGFWFLLLVGVVVVSLVMQLSLKGLTKEYEKNQNEYQALAGSMATNQKVKYQAKVVSKVLVDRFEYGKSMEMIKNLFSQDIVISNLEIGERKVFTIFGTVVDGSKLSEVEQKVIDINYDLIEGFSSAKMTGLSYDPIKNWQFQVEVKLK